MVNKKEEDILKTLNNKMDDMDDIQKAEFKGYLSGIALMTNQNKDSKRKPRRKQT